MISYELRLFRIAGAVARVYPFECTDNDAAMRQIAILLTVIKASGTAFGF
jgi:hypothetical protein